ncbi:MAG TPA: Maf family protein [Tepidisphaeraceae bacterium]|nr:Maf family protein [Tepidisphaeraceae bacterium]
MTDKAPRLILASASPRRQQLLREAGYEFIVQASDVDEAAAPTLLPVELARHLSLIKAAAVAPQFPDDVVLAADTIVAFGDKTLGKPADAIEARRTLTLLSGTTHVVITGVTLIQQGNGYQRTSHAMSAVHMRRLTLQEIQEYLASGQWVGKAGAYGIQDPDPFVTNMSGSLSNIVGLPMELTQEMLSESGIFPKTA